MRSVEIMVAGAALLAGALLIGWVVVRRTSFRRRPGTLPPPPPAWREWIERHVALTRDLTTLEWERLLGLVGRFLREKQFEGIDGLEVDLDMKLCVAAQACLLILNLDADCYPAVRSVLLYPGTFVPKLTPLDHRLYTSPVPEPTPLLGQHLRGVVVLSWESVARSTFAPDGGNVVLHEFAHELDRENGEVDGVPLLEAPSSTREWARVLQRRYEELRQAALDETPSALSAYGATNRAEFFAVATEAFFERPAALQSQSPDLYMELQGFYRQDPAARGRPAP